MFSKYLSKIAEIEKKFGDELNPPATPKEIQYLKNKVENIFGAVLPDQYVEFLSKVNGLHFDGLNIYGVDTSLLENNYSSAAHGFIEFNEVWYEVEDLKQYLFFGDSDISWYCLKLAEGSYQILDKPSGTIIETYPDFVHMFEAELKIRLQ
jgi:hypothetical protein